MYVKYTACYVGVSTRKKNAAGKGDRNVWCGAVVVERVGLLRGWHFNKSWKKWSSGLCKYPEINTSERDNSMCKVPEARVYLICATDMKEPSMARTEWMKGKVVGNKFRQVKGSRGHRSHRALYSVDFIFYSDGEPWWEFEERRDVGLKFSPHPCGCWGGSRSEVGRQVRLFARTQKRENNSNRGVKSRKSLDIF